MQALGTFLGEPFYSKPRIWWVEGSWRLTVSHRALVAVVRDNDYGLANVEAQRFGTWRDLLGR